MSGEKLDQHRINRSIERYKLTAFNNMLKLSETTAALKPIDLTRSFS